MAKDNFDFNSFKGKKLNVYKKEHCKPNDVRKSKGGIVLIDYKLAGKKTPCVFIPFKKLPEAQKVYKQIKAEKEHIMKKVAYVEVNVATGADGKEEITLEVKKGGVSPDLLISKGADLFEGGIKMALKVIGSATGTEVEEESTEEEVVEDTSKTDTTVDPKVKAEKKGKRLGAYNKIKDNTVKLEGAVGKVDNTKLEANIIKFEDALDKLITEAEADGEIDADEQAMIDEIQGKLDALYKSMEASESGETPQGKKLTPEQRQKINDNMTKINAKLDAILSKLGV